MLVGLGVDFVSHLASKVVKSLTIEDKDLCGSIPVAPYPNCPDTRCGGIVHCMFLIYEKAYVDGIAANKAAKGDEIYDAAIKLFMSSIST
jgi:hypothetical protein